MGDPISPDGINTSPNDHALAAFYEPFIEGGVLKLEGSMPFPPPWYLPVEAPPCNAHLHVPAEKTNDGHERNFWCDRVQGHTEKGEKSERHRMVTNNDEGSSFTWK